MKNLTAIVISFLRPEYTKKCITSLQKTHPKIQILVGENGKYDDNLFKFLKKRNIPYFLMPFDSGVGFARNRLMDEVKTEFVLVGDDDFFYTEEACVDKMVKFLEKHDEFDLIGGRIFERGQIRNYQGFMQKQGDMLRYQKLDLDRCELDKKSGIHYQACDLTFNFFVARHDRIRDVRWDEKIKVAYEHSDWFLNAKAHGISVAFTSDAVVIHKPKLQKQVDDKYFVFRNRNSDREYFFKKHKIAKLVDMNDRSDEIRFFADKYYALRSLDFEGRTYNKGDIIETKNPNEYMIPV
jgi:GT2 family glycosyltransferase